MKTFLILCFATTVIGCVSDDKYTTVERERDILQRKLNDSTNASRIDGIRANALAIIRSIYSDTFDPLRDAPLVSDLLLPTNRPLLLAALKDETLAIENILNAYSKAMEKSGPELLKYSKNFKQKDLEFRTKEAEIKSASKEVDVSQFERASVMLSRKFADDGQYSSYEAYDFRKSRKVVALVPNDVEVKPPSNLDSYAKSLGDRPFQNAITNDYRSYERTEYLLVLKIATAAERAAITGFEVEMRQLKRELDWSEGELGSVLARAKSVIRANISLSSITPEIQRLVDPAGCGKQNAASLNVKSVEPQASASQTENVNAPKVRIEEMDSAPTTKPLVDKCERDLAEYIKSEVGTLTSDNHSAVSSNCRLYPRRWLCFTRKVREAGGSISLAEKPRLESECGI